MNKKIKHILTTICCISLLLGPNTISQAINYIKINSNDHEKDFSSPRLYFVSKLIQLGKFKEAKETLYTILNVDPTNIKALLYLALLSEASRSDKDAIFFYKKVLEIQPNHKTANHQYGLLLDKNKKTKKGLKYLLKAAGLMPHNAMLYYDIGIVYSKIYNYNESIRYYKKAVHLNPEFAEAHNNLCYSLACRGDYKNALGYCKKSLKIAPESAATLDSMGYVYYGLNEFDKALKYFEDAVNTNPELAEIYLHIAQTLDKQGKIEESKEYYYKYFELETDLKRAKKIKSSLNIKL